MTELNWSTGETTLLGARVIKSKGKGRVIIPQGTLQSTHIISTKIYVMVLTVPCPSVEEQT